MHLYILTHQRLTLTLWLCMQVKGPGPGQYDSVTIRKPPEVSSSFRSQVPRFNSRKSVSQNIQYLTLRCTASKLAVKPHVITLSIHIPKTLHRRCLVQEPIPGMILCLDSPNHCQLQCSTCERNMELRCPEQPPRLCSYDWQLTSLFFFTPLSNYIHSL